MLESEFVDQLRLFRQMLDKQLESFGGLHHVGRNQIMSRRPKNRVQGVGVVVPGRCHQGIDGSCGEAKVCSSAAGARTGSVSARSARPGPNVHDHIRRHLERRPGFIGGNVCVEIMGLNGSMLWLGI
jgi:hypothetical protein